MRTRKKYYVRYRRSLLNSTCRCTGYSYLDSLCLQLPPLFKSAQVHWSHWGTFLTVLFSFLWSNSNSVFIIIEVMVNYVLSIYLLVFLHCVYITDTKTEIIVMGANRANLIYSLLETHEHLRVAWNHWLQYCNGLPILRFSLVGKSRFTVSFDLDILF